MARLDPTPCPLCGRHHDIPNDAGTHKACPAWGADTPSFGSHSIQRRLSHQAPELLVERIAELEAEVADLLQVVGDYEKEVLLDEAVAGDKWLREEVVILRKFSQHLPGCLTPLDGRACSCGFSEARR